MIRLTLILFIIGIIFIIIGFAHQISPSKEVGREIEFVPRKVYDEIVMSTIIK